MITFGSLFSGIGGIDLGLERAGMVCKWQVEIDPFCQKVLKKHWPDVARYEDVRTVGKHNLEPVDLICGGFPCQDISRVNVNGAGLDGELSGLWWEYYRLIGELRPGFALVENVSNLSNRGLSNILGRLAEIGYDAEWSTLSACAFGAPHTRERMFIVAYPHRDRQQAIRNQGIRHGSKVFAGGKYSDHVPQTSLSGSGARGLHWAVEPGMARMAYGVPDRVDRNHALGNAVVPQVAEWIGRRIVEAEARP